MSFQRDTFLAVLMAGLIVVVAGLLVFYLSPLHEDPYQSRPSASNDGTAASMIAGADGELLCAVQSLERSIRELNRNFERAGLAGGTSPKGDERKTRIEPDDKRLDTLIESLIQVIQGSSLSSERNTLLRDRYLSLGSKEPGGLKRFWQTDKGARDDLFMMTYSQVLERLGPPEIVFSSAGLDVRWNYPDGQVTFIDGFAVAASLD